MLTDVEIFPNQNNDEALPCVLNDIRGAPMNPFSHLTINEINQIRMFFPFRLTGGNLTLTDARNQLQMFIQEFPILYSCDFNRIMLKIQYFIHKHNIVVKQNQFATQIPMLQFDNQQPTNLPLNYQTSPVSGFLE